jgi:hypothetical protein
MLGRLIALAAWHSPAHGSRARTALGGARDFARRSDDAALDSRSGPDAR